jgi:hypothetical protein
MEASVSFLAVAPLVGAVHDSWSFALALIVVAIMVWRTNC